MTVNAIQVKSNQKKRIDHYLMLGALILATHSQTAPMACHFSTASKVPVKPQTKPQKSTNSTTIQNLLNSIADGTIAGSAKLDPETAIVLFHFAQIAKEFGSIVANKEKIEVVGKSIGDIIANLIGIASVAASKSQGTNTQKITQAIEELQTRFGFDYAQEIAERLGQPPKTISYHVKKQLPQLS